MWVIKMARKKRGKDSITFEVRKPPSDITFIPPDSILEPYPKKVKIEAWGAPLLVYN